MTFTPSIFWLLAFLVLCVMEVVTPTAFVELMMGFSALMVAGVAMIFPQLAVGLQIGLWMLLSLSLVFGSRRFLPTRKVYTIADATSAETLTEILPGQAGRVLYEGNSWRAKCDDSISAIAPSQKVYVLRREGNTLIVMPEHLLH